MGQRLAESHLERFLLFTIISHLLQAFKVYVYGARYPVSPTCMSPT
jgi:hypothetical protein